MNKKIRNRLVAAIILFTAILIPSLLALDYFNSTKEIVVTYKNSHQVELFDTSGDQEGKGGLAKPLSEIKNTGDSIRLKKDSSYIISYKANPGFKDGYITVNLASNNKVISINPYYTEAKLASLLDKEFGSIKASFGKKYNRISLYEIQKGRLYHFGDWYGATLQYIGTDNSNSDTLRAVLHKNNGLWEVVTDPPNISLDKFTYPNIPFDILTSVNNDLVTPRKKSIHEGGAHFAQ